MVSTSDGKGHTADLWRSKSAALKSSAVRIDTPAKARKVVKTRSSSYAAELCRQGFTGGKRVYTLMQNESVLGRSRLALRLAKPTRRKEPGWVSAAIRSFNSVLRCHGATEVLPVPH